eukprot:9260648-Lingulodinium_polyedra.AAC.1
MSWLRSVEPPTQTEATQDREERSPRKTGVCCELTAASDSDARPGESTNRTNTQYKQLDGQTLGNA